MSHISKSIREVTNLSRFAPFGAFSLSNQGIADVGFAGDQVIILQNVEGTNLELALVDITLHLVAVFRANFQIVIENNGLAIQVETFELRIIFKKIKQIVKEFHQLHAVTFKR